MSHAAIKALTGLLAALAIGTLQAQIDAADTCEGKAEGAACWLKVENRDCYIWDPYHRDSGTAAWDGQCKGGLADGEGMATWIDKDGEVITEKGILTAGKAHGTEVRRDPDGTVTKTTLWVNGEEHP